METITMKARFKEKQGFFSRLFGLGKGTEGFVMLKPCNEMSLMGHDLVYAADEVGKVRPHYRAGEDGVESLDVEMKEGFSFTVYGQEAVTFMAWLIRQEICIFGFNWLREESQKVREHLEWPVLEQLAKWHEEDDRNIRRPKEDLNWEEVDENFRKWITTACAIIHTANNMDWHELGGASHDDPMGREFGRQVLEHSWEITTRPELIDTIQYMMGDNLVWQLLRSMQNAGFGYLAGYLTLRETMNVALAAGKRLQKVTHSWEDLGKAYLRSYRINMGEGRDYERRVESFERLMGSQDSPYEEVDFDMELCRSW